MASTSTTTMHTSAEGQGGSSTVTKTTTYEARSSNAYVAESATPSYRPSIAPRTYIIQRTSIGGSAAGGGGSASRSVERSAQYGALQAGAPAGRQTDHRVCSYHYTAYRFTKKIPVSVFLTSLQLLALPSY